MPSTSHEKESSGSLEIVWPELVDASSGKEIAEIRFDASGIPWDVFDVGMLLLEYQTVKDDNRALKMENQRLNRELQAAQACQSDPEPVIELRKISRAKAKKEIAAYFRKNDGREIWPDEIMEQLRIDLETVLEICDELAQEEKIKPL